MNHQTSMVLARLGLQARVSLSPALNHPVGMKMGFFLVVVIFLAVLGLTMAVGHLRDRRRQRRAETDLPASRRDSPPPTR
ncbi:hypothetical protein GCM10009740_01200 [Terrabacter terrae]|uniref:Uncharacterized protein n=1 Tax=Terrabacter terrae TaxID=318434 RepID=A0ABN2TQZ6_9MICO